VPKAYSVILGDGVLFEKLTEQIRQNNLIDRVRLLGYCNHDMVVDVLRAGDIFVMPSRSEGVPYALLEAGALGMPILATRCGGIPDVLVDGVEALLVSVGDVPALASGLVRLATNEKALSWLGNNAKSKIEREFSLSAQIRDTRNSYLKAFAHKHKVEHSMLVDKVF
jgi:glycosyltransferase involved in cell wall biosynthesis